MASYNYEKRKRREQRELEALAEAERYEALSIADKIREAITLDDLKEVLARHFEDDEHDAGQ